LIFTGAELQQLNGHADWVRSVAFSHDGIHIVSGSRDKSVRVWDASTGAELQQLNGHTALVNSVAFSHDGIHIVSGSYDWSVRVWDASTGAGLQRLNGHANWVRSVAFSNDGIHIVSGSDDKSVRVWGARTDAELEQLNGPTVSDSDVTSIWVWNEMHHGVLWTSTRDGWIVSLLGQYRLMWIPQGIHGVVHHPYNILIISQEGYAHIDFQGCNLGMEWKECYKPFLL
jgi:WD40 repeat protein